MPRYDFTLRKNYLEGRYIWHSSEGIGLDQVASNGDDEEI